MFHTGVPEKVECLFLGEPADIMGEHEDTRDVVVDPADDGAAESGRQDVLMDREEDGCLSPRLFGLRDVHVHLVTIKIGVKRCTYQWVQLYSFTFNQFWLEGLD